MKYTQSQAKRMHGKLEETNNELAELIEMYNMLADPWSYVDGQTCHENQLLLNELKESENDN